MRKDTAADAAVSSSSPPLPHPLLHLGDTKKLQPLTSLKLFAAATGTGGDQALDALLSARLLQQRERRATAGEAH